MKLLLTSFGLSAHGGRNELINPAARFYRMPPVEMTSPEQELQLPFHLLLMYEKIVLDEATFGALIEHRRPREFDKVADAITALRTEGFIELIDYRRAIENHAQLIEEMTVKDLGVFPAWVSALEESEGIWAAFATLNRVSRSKARLRAMDKSRSSWLTGKTSRIESGLSRFESGAWRGKELNSGTPKDPGAWRPAQKRTRTQGEAKDELTPPTSIGDLVSRAPLAADESLQPGDTASSLDRASNFRLNPTEPEIVDLLAPRIAYANANLVLANQLNIPFYDWADFGPIYRQKFRSIGQLDAEVSQVDVASRELFSIMPPQFSVHDSTHLIRILRHRHVDDLRNLVQAATAGLVSFDHEFAKRAIGELVSGDIISGKRRRIASYATSLLNFIPGLTPSAQMAIDLVAGESMDAAIAGPHRRGLRWLYLLGEATRD